MKTANLVFSVIFVTAALGVAISQLKVTEDSNTEARVRLAEKVLAKCRAKDGAAFNKPDCIYNYGKEENLPEQKRMAWATDGYGNLLVLDQPAACKSAEPCAVYSIGKNGIDECGTGDDVTSQDCR